MTALLGLPCIAAADSQSTSDGAALQSAYATKDGTPSRGEPTELPLAAKGCCIPGRIAECPTITARECRASKGRFVKSCSAHCQRYDISVEELFEEMDWIPVGPGGDEFADEASFQIPTIDLSGSPSAFFLATMAVLSAI